MKNTPQMLLPLAVVALLVVFACKFSPYKPKKEGYFCASCMMK